MNFTARRTECLAGRFYCASPNSRVIRNGCRNRTQPRCLRRIAGLPSPAHRTSRPIHPSLGSHQTKSLHGQASPLVKVSRLPPIWRFVMAGRDRGRAEFRRSTRSISSPAIRSGRSGHLRRLPGSQTVSEHHLRGTECRWYSFPPLSCTAIESHSDDNDLC
jgi:hypothetical protein